MEGGTAYEAVIILGKERGGQIAVTGIRQEYYDILALVFRLFGLLYGGSQGGTGGYADENTFTLGELTAIFEGILIVDGGNLIIDFVVQGLRYKPGPDALNFMWAGSSFTQYR